MTPYYADDLVTIYHGDMRDVMRDVPSITGDLVVTSPPYFNARDYGSEAWTTFTAYLDDLRSCAAAIFDSVAPGRMAAFVVSPVIEARTSRAGRSIRHNIPAELHGLCAEWWFQEDITWLKPEGSAINRNQRFTLDRHPLQWRANPTTERILVYQKPTPDLNDDIIRGKVGGRVDEFERSDVWRINPDSSGDHPAPFPIGIPARLITYYSWPGETVLDPFMGSGTTLRAAKSLGRRSIGIEIEERYCEIAAQRCSQEVLGLSA